MLFARATLLFVILHAGCSRSGAPGERPRSTDADPGPVATGAPTFRREAFAAPGDAGAGEPPVPATVDPAALDEILAAASRRPAAAGPDGGDRGGLVGSDSGVPSDGGAAMAASPPDPARSSKIHVGKVTVEPGMSSPTVERAARAQLYWPLVQRCRDHDGAILPPEVVHLAFHLDRDGYVIPATILAVPREPRFADAARCMARELSMATFRAPAAARGLPQNVSTDVPSVD